MLKNPVKMKTKFKKIYKKHITKLKQQNTCKCSTFILFISYGKDTM